MKVPHSVFAIPVAVTLLTEPIRASEPIVPYLEEGESGPFRYAIYNNQWLSHGPAAPAEKDAGRVAITGVLPGTKGEVAIPASIDGHEVYGIDENALDSGPGITAIHIPETVRFLRPGTLNRARALEAIHVAATHPDFASVDGVMFDKPRTTLLAFPSGRRGDYRVPEGTDTIGPFAFSRCWLLTSVVIPDSVTDIGGHSGGVFEGCGNLRHVGIPDTVTNIGQKSFQDCDRLGEITLPPRLADIPFGLFWRCSHLSRVTLPDGITRIGNYAFAGCAKLTLDRLPERLTTIGAYAFKDCKGLKGLKVPASVTDIGRGAFQGCEVEAPGQREDANHEKIK